MPRRTAVAILIVLAATTSCKDKQEKKGEPAASAEQEGRGDQQPAPGRDPTEMRSRAEALRRMRLAPITVDEVKPFLPALPGATPVGQPGVLTGGRQVKAILCVPGDSADAVTRQLVAAVEKLGFSAVKTRPHPRSPDMVTLHGERQPFRLGGTVQRSSTADCPATSGKVKVVLSYFKRVAVGPGEVAAPGSPPAPLAPGDR